MLVLALQFSKGSERGRMLDDFLTRIATSGEGHWQSRSRRAHRGQRERSSMPSPRVDNPKWVDSLKTEEKTKLVERACQEDESCD